MFFSTPHDVPAFTSALAVATYEVQVVPGTLLNPSQWQALSPPYVAVTTLDGTTHHIAHSFIPNSNLSNDAVVPQADTPAGTLLTLNVDLLQSAISAAGVIAGYALLKEHHTTTTYIAPQVYRRGDVILDATPGWAVAKGAFVVGSGEKKVSFPHRCHDFAAVYVGPYVNSIVAARDIALGEVVSVNTCLVSYAHADPFPSTCTGKLVTGFIGLDDATRQDMCYLTEPNVRSAAYDDGWVVKSSNPSVTVRPNGEMGLAAYAVDAMGPGTVLFKCVGLVVPAATMYTIQQSRTNHLLFGHGAECIAHFCDPNVKVVLQPDGASFNFVLRRGVQAGEMLGFNYQSTEWSMQQGFKCLCGAACCAKDVMGFKHMPDTERKRMWEFSTDVVRDLSKLIQENKPPMSDSTNKPQPERAMRTAA